MAYLANDDEEAQQKQANGGAFDAFGGGPQPQDQGSGGAGASQLNSWIGSSGGQASQGQSGAQSATDQAQSSAKDYQSTYAGDGNSSAKQDAQPDKPSFAASPQAGLSGSGQGTGFINFQNYENNAPSQADAIAKAGQQVIGAENGSLDDAEAAVKNGIPNAGGSVYAGATDQGGIDTITQQLLNGDDGGGAGVIQHVLDPTLSPTDVNYTPSDTYTKGAPELTQTPVTGGQGAPSVVDWIAKDQIAQGGYTQGNRMLDNALIAGDSKAQQAIQANQALDKTFQGRLANEVPQLQAQATAANDAATQTAAGVQQSLTDTAAKLQGDIASATAAYNANPSPQTVANEEAAIKAYQDWYNSGGQQGGSWTGTGTGASAATAVVTPQQAEESDVVWKLQHPGDNDPSHLPYPDPNKVAGAGVASTYGGSGTGAVTASTAPIWDPGDAPGKSGNNGISAAEKMTEILSNPTWWSHAQQDLTPSEIAVLVTVHPEAAKFYPAPSSADLRQAASYLMGSVQSAPTVQTVGGPPQANLGNRLQPVLDQVMAKLNANNKTPYDYGKSIGMTDAQLLAMGIGPANGKVLKPTPGQGVDIGGTIRNLG